MTVLVIVFTNPALAECQVGRAQVAVTISVGVLGSCYHRSTGRGWRDKPLDFWILPRRLPQGCQRLQAALHLRVVLAISEARRCTRTREGQAARQGISWAALVTRAHDARTWAWHVSVWRAILNPSTPQLESTTFIALCVSNTCS